MAQQLDSPHIVSFLLDDDGGAGHVYDYHRAVSQATEQLGWVHSVHLTKRHALDHTPNHWHADLSPLLLRSEEHSNTARIKALDAMSKSIAKVLNEKSEQPRIAFLEAFSASHLIAFTNAFRTIRKGNWHIWLLFRGIQSMNTAWRRILYASLLKSLHASTTGRLTTMTDSELLSSELKNVFQRAFYTLPIPHAPALTDTTSSVRHSIPEAPISCWWAGAPRPEKGIEAMKHIVGLADDSSKKLTVIASKSAGLRKSLTKDGVNLIETDDALPREEYQRIMTSVDFILLPYDPIAYQHRTSGIFIEAINANRIPLTTRGSWMGAELERHELDSLALPISDWLSDTITNRIVTLVGDSNTRKRLETMAKSYATAHSSQSFAAAMKSIWNKQHQP
jgi:hypothetical protein